MSKISDPSNAARQRAPVLPIAVAYGGVQWRANAFPALQEAPPAEIVLNQVISPSGAVLPNQDGVDQFDDQAVPLRGLSTGLTGEWLLELLGKMAWRAAEPGYRLCGPALSPAQARVLEKLGAMESYIPLPAPARFRAIANVPAARQPPAVVKDYAALLRPAMPAGDARIAILPQHATEVFALANRASLAAWLRAKRFALLDPETMNFDELTHALGSSGTIMIADPRQAGILPLCSPAAKIIDIAPLGWRSMTNRLLCELLGQSWVCCDAGPPSYKLLTALPFGARVPLSYEVPIGDLARLLQTL